MRWKNFGEMSTDDGHKVYFSGEEGKHEYGVGFLVHKDVVGAVLGCQPVSSRLISIRLRALDTLSGKTEDCLRWRKPRKSAIF